MATPLGNASIVSGACLICLTTSHFGCRTQTGGVWQAHYVNGAFVISVLHSPLVRKPHPDLPPLLYSLPSFPVPVVAREAPIRFTAHARAAGLINSARGARFRPRLPGARTPCYPSFPRLRSIASDRSSLSAFTPIVPRVRSVPPRDRPSSHASVYRSEFRPSSSSPIRFTTVITFKIDIRKGIA